MICIQRLFTLTNPGRICSSGGVGPVNGATLMHCWICDTNCWCWHATVAVSHRVNHTLLASNTCRALICTSQELSCKVLTTAVELPKHSPIFRNHFLFFFFFLQRSRPLRSLHSGQAEAARERLTTSHKQLISPPLCLTHRHTLFTSLIANGMLGR